MNETLEKLKFVLDKNKDKRITVIGTTCTGKTTLLKNIPEGIEISKLAPPLTTKCDYHCQK
jgi:ABC-type phosphate/phosphonate transport system ATPase subunit